MNRTDRLLAIVLELQGKGRLRAEDLASTFETSKRTIYRDIQALCEAGVPVVSVPGQGYSLMEGYFLPPLSFTSEEATMLLLGSDFMAQNFDAQYKAAAQSASRKIEGVLPEHLRDDVRYLQSSIRFVAASEAEDSPQRKKLQQLRRAILESHTISFHYHKRLAQDGDAQTSREADPYGLIYILHTWHLIAYCHMRQATRVFRLDRMDGLKLLARTFHRPADFSISMARSERESSRDITVRVLFDTSITRWVREARSFYTTAEEETPDGLLVTLRIRHTDEILQWLLGWGRHAYVLEPESLQVRLQEEARAILSHYQITEWQELPR
jgi:predicted DNA-binding transcriptional regulator YafY